MLKKKKKTRAGHRAYVTKIQPEVRTCIENFDEDVKPRVIVLKTSLEEQLATLTELDKEILELLEEKEDAVEDEELENEIEESCNIRAEISANITIMNALLVPTPQPAESLAAEQPTETAPPQKSVRVKLPKLEVKKFSGKIDECQEFWDNYESAIDGNKNLSDVDKFSYLRGLLEGPAKSAIAGFALTAVNYGAAIALLKKRFGKRNVIQRAHIDELMKVSPLHNERDTTRLKPCTMAWKPTTEG